MCPRLPLSSGMAFHCAGGSRIGLTSLKWDTATWTIMERSWLCDKTRVPVIRIAGVAATFVRARCETMGAATVKCTTAAFDCGKGEC